MWNVEWPFGTRIFSHRCHRSMRTDGSFHGSFTLAPLPAAWFLMRHRRNGSRFFRMRSETASVQIGEICGRQISAQCAKEQAGFILPQMPQIDTDAMRAESPMTSIAQGKRSDALGKPKRHATPCKSKSTSNTLCFNAFAPAWRKLHGTLHPGYSCLVQRQSRAATGLRTSGPPSFHGCNMRRFPHSSSRPAQRLQA